MSKLSKEQWEEEDLYIVRLVSKQGKRPNHMQSSASKLLSNTCPAIACITEQLTCKAWYIVRSFSCLDTSHTIYRSSFSHCYLDSLPNKTSFDLFRSLDLGSAHYCLGPIAHDPHNATKAHHTQGLIRDVTFVEVGRHDDP